MKMIWKKGLSLLLALVLAASCLLLTVLAEECPHTAYLEGKCNSCGAPCTHLVYVGGVCPICGAAEPVTLETTPVPTETTPVPTETTPVPTETTPVPTETTPVPTETTPVPTETTPVPTETTPAPAETTAPSESAVPAETQETTPSMPVAGQSSGASAPAANAQAESDYTLTNGKLVIRDGVTKIDADAFRGRTDITSVEIPASVTSIGSYAFYKCTSLTQVIIRGNLNAVGDNAFAYCSSISIVQYWGTTEPQQAGPNAFFGVYAPISVTNAYPSKIFCGNMVRKNLTEKPEKYTVTVTAGAGGTVTGGGVFEANTPVTVTATPNEGYTFVNWTENGKQNTTEATYIFTVTRDRNLVANFAPAHVHNWKNSASGDTITRECTAEGCPENEKLGTATIVVDHPSIQYDGEFHGAAVATSGNLDGEDFPITYTDFNGSTSTDAPIAAGSYIASITLSEASASVDFVIVCKELSGISAATRAYDGTNTVTFSDVQGIIDGDDAAVIGTMSDPNAGEEKPVTLSITGEDAANYRLSTDKATATITPAHVTVTAKDQAISYGDAIPALTYLAEGVVQNETLTGVLATTATAGSNVGTYPITQGTLTKENNPNYNIAFTGASVVIGPKTVNPLTLIPEHQTYVHTGSEIAIAVTVQDGTTPLPVGQYSLSIGDTTKVGPVTITAFPVEGGNYTFSETSTKVLILPDTSSLTQETITADDQEKIDALQQQMDQIDPNDFLPLSEEAKEAWQDIQEQLEALEQTIQEAEETSDEITKEVSELPEVPTTGDLDQIEELLKTYEDIEGNLTEEQKEALADEIQKLEELKEALEETNQEYQGLLNQVEGMKEKDLSFSDKQAIEKLKADIDEQKKDPQLTEAQKTGLDQAKEDLDALFAEADAVTVQLNQLPATSDPDDETNLERYEAAKKAYGDLGDQQDMADPKAVEKLNALRDALKAYKIIKGHGATYIKSTGGSLEFTANGLFEHYDSVEIDGKAVDKSNFDTKKGSTIVTLKASYVKTLSNGEHEIKVHFRDADNPELDGYAQGKFSVVQSTGVADPTNPKTGDGFPMAQWSALAGISLLCAAALLLNRKKIY